MFFIYNQWYNWGNYYYIHSENIISFWTIRYISTNIINTIQYLLKILIKVYIMVGVPLAGGQWRKNGANFHNFPYENF